MLIKIWNKTLVTLLCVSMFSINMPVVSYAEETGISIAVQESAPIVEAPQTSETSLSDEVVQTSEATPNDEDSQSTETAPNNENSQSTEFVPNNENSQSTEFVPNDKNSQTIETTTNDKNSQTIETTLIKENTVQKDHSTDEIAEDIQNETVGVDKFLFLQPLSNHFIKAALFARATDSTPDTSNWPGTNNHDGCSHANYEHFYATGRTYLYQTVYYAEGRYFESHGIQDYYIGSKNNLFGSPLADTYDFTPTAGWYYKNPKDNTWKLCTSDNTPVDGTDSTPLDSILISSIAITSYPTKYQMIDGKLTIVNDDGTVASASDIKLATQDSDKYNVVQISTYTLTDNRIYVCFRPKEGYSFLHSTLFSGPNTTDSGVILSDLSLALIKSEKAFGLTSAKLGDFTCSWQLEEYTGRNLTPEPKPAPTTSSPVDADSNRENAVETTSSTITEKTTPVTHIDYKSFSKKTTKFTLGDQTTIQFPATITAIENPTNLFFDLHCQTANETDRIPLSLIKSIGGNRDSRIISLNTNNTDYSKIANITINRMDAKKSKISLYLYDRKNNRLLPFLTLEYVNGKVEVPVALASWHILVVEE